MTTKKGLKCCLGGILIFHETDVFLDRTVGTVFLFLLKKKKVKKQELLNKLNWHYSKTC